MIFVIDDDRTMAECVGRATKDDFIIFDNAIEAMMAISDGKLPSLVFLDILLDGPDGFTFLNELMSYSDTAKIPIVIISSLNFEGQDFSKYGVVGVLNKDNMLPVEIRSYVKRYA